MTLEELQVVITARTDGLNKELQKVQSQLKSATKNVDSSVNKIKSSFMSMAKGIAIAFGVTKLVQFGTEATKMAMTVEGSLSQIKRTMGESSNHFLKWSKNTGSALGMAQADLMKYGATFGNLLSGFAGSNTGKATEDLLQAGAIIASNTGRSIEDVMERIRSGLLGSTEAIEDLGVNVNVAMLESTKAFRQFAGDKSWNQLDFQTQQQIRYAAILEQTYSKFGTEVAQNTNTSLLQLTAVLKDIKLNIGQAFLPIAQVVIPWLTNLAIVVRDVTANLAVFMQALFGVDIGANSINKAGDFAQNAAAQTNAYNSALADTGATADKTAKQMNRLLGGFDELNTLTNSGVDGGLGGAGGGIGTITPPVTDFPEPDTSGIKKAVEKIKKFFNDMSKVWENNKSVIASGIAFLTGGPLLMLVEKFLEVAFTNESVNARLKAVWGDIVEFFTKVFSDVGTSIQDTLDKYLGPIMTNFVKFSKWLEATATILWKTVLLPIMENGLKVWNWLWDTYLKDLVSTVMDFGGKLAEFVSWLYANFIGPLITLVAGVMGPIIADTIMFMQDNFGTFFGAVAGYIKGVIRELGGIIDFVMGIFSGNWERAWQGVKDIFGGIWDSISTLCKVPLNIVIDLTNKAIRGLNNLLSFELPGFLGGGKVGIEIPEIPKLARGGIVNKSTIANIGEAGKEAVIPLENNTEGLDLIASKIAGRLGGTGGGNVTIQLSVGGTKFGEVVVNSLNDLGRRNGGVIPINI